MWHYIFILIGSTSQACLCTLPPTYLPIRGQVSLFSDLAALLINSGHTCVSVSVVTSLQPLRYTQRPALYDQALTEQITLFSSTWSLSLCSAYVPSLTSQETDTKRRSLSGGRLNEPLLTMVKITTNLSLQEATVQWTSLGPTAGHSGWLTWNWYCPGDSMEGNQWALQKQSEGK